jgi:hypothetical protein
MESLDTSEPWKSGTFFMHECSNKLLSTKTARIQKKGNRTKKE